MSEPVKPIRWPGRAVGIGLFVVVALPSSLMFLVAERECDMHIGPPCEVSWGVQKLLFLLSMSIFSLFAGWLTNKVINEIRSERRPPSECPLTNTSSHSHSDEGAL